MMHDMMGRGVMSGMGVLGVVTIVVLALVVGGGPDTSRTGRARGSDQVGRLPHRGVD